MNISLTSKPLKHTKRQKGKKAKKKTLNHQQFTNKKVAMKFQKRPQNNQKFN